MFSEDTIRSLLPILLGLPVAAGLLVALLGCLKAGAKLVRG